MFGLTITEANSLLDRPILFSDGEFKEVLKVIPSNMDRLYLKFESATLSYNFGHPYIKNFNTAMSKMYPVIKGNMAYGGVINKSVDKHLLIEFNCLGIEGT